MLRLSPAEIAILYRNTLAQSQTISSLLLQERMDAAQRSTESKIQVFLLRSFNISIIKPRYGFQYRYETPRNETPDFKIEPRVKVGDNNNTTGHTTTHVHDGRSHLQSPNPRSCSLASGTSGSRLGVGGGCRQSAACVSLLLGRC